MVLCHGVLEILEDPAAALVALSRVLRPGGTLSLLVNQRHAAVVTRAMAGHFGQARALLDVSALGPVRPGGPHRRFTADEITAVLDETGFDTTAMHAVRVFADLVSSSLWTWSPVPPRPWSISSWRWRPVPSTSPWPPRSTPWLSAAEATPRREEPW